jgi:protein AFG1
VFSDEKGKEADEAHMRSSEREFEVSLTSVLDDLGLSAETVGSSSLFSGDEELFAFARCVSRLSQMG